MVWWPFTQHASMGDGDVTFIESAHADKFRTIQPAPVAGAAAGVTKIALTTGPAEVAAAASFYSESDAALQGASSSEQEVRQQVWNMASSGGAESRVSSVRGGATKGNEEDEDGRVSANIMFDGCGSWWTQGVGHGHPAMALALAEAAGRYV